MKTDIISVATVLLFYTGFFFHTCKDTPFLGRYSFRYLILVDFAQKLPSTLEFFVDGVHLTPEGNRILSGYLKEVIIKINR